MDLIYTDAARRELGVLQEYELDLAIGEDENDFALTMARASHCCAPGAFVYAENTEYGGIVDALRSRPAADEITYTGRTWHGILNSKVIEPDSGKNYLTVSGDANEVLAFLVVRLELSGLFSAANAASGISISGYQFPRYCKGYDGIRALLAAHGAKLVLRMRNGMVTLSAAPAVRLEDADTDDASVSLDVTRAYHTVNHLICLGKGELAARTVLHLYADETGSISTTKTQTGLDEIAEVYDYPSVESVADLEQKGRQKLAELWQPARVVAAMDESAGDLDVGDSKGAIDEVTGIEVAATITKKIVTVRNGRITVDYKVGV